MDLKAGIAHILYRACLEVEGSILWWWLKKLHEGFRTQQLFLKRAAHLSMIEIDLGYRYLLLVCDDESARELGGNNGLDHGGKIEEAQIAVQVALCYAHILHARFKPLGKE